MQNLSVVVVERRVREIVRHMRERRGTFAFAYWLPVNASDDPMARYFFTGGKGAPICLWFTRTQSKRQLSRLVCEVAAETPEPEQYAILAQALDTDANA
jgi:hypothetical protein